MKKTKSLSVVTGFFMGFLFSTVCNHYNEVYEPLTQHLADGNNSLAVMFGLELTAYVIIGFCLCLFVWNINKKRFFVKQNYICFYVIGIALYSPVFVYAKNTFKGVGNHRSCRLFGGRNFYACFGWSFSLWLFVEGGTRFNDLKKGIMSIIVNLDVVMAKRKISLGELAERIDLTPANLSILKTGKAKAIRFSTLEAICKELNCQPGDILEYKK